VLEHVRHPRLADLLVHGSDVRVEVEGNDGNLVALHDEERHPVLEPVLGHRFLERGEILKGRGESEQEKRSAKHLQSLAHPQRMLLSRA
jgi:hypothetical protein